MSEKKRIAISKNLENFILNLACSEKTQTAWSKHINRMMLDHITIVKTYYPYNLDPDILNCLEVISAPYKDELYSYKFGQNIQLFFYDIYYKLEKSETPPPNIKNIFLEKFMHLNLNHLESLGLVTYLQLTTKS